MPPEIGIALFLPALGGLVFLTGGFDEWRWRREAKAREDAARTGAE